MQTQGCSETKSFVWHTIAFEPVGDSLDLHGTALLSCQMTQKAIEWPAPQKASTHSALALFLHVLAWNLTFHIFLRFAEFMLTTKARRMQLSPSDCLCHYSISISLPVNTQLQSNWLLLLISYVGEIHHAGCFYTLTETCRISSCGTTNLLKSSVCNQRWLLSVSLIFQYDALLSQLFLVGVSWFITLRKKKNIQGMSSKSAIWHPKRELWLQFWQRHLLHPQNFTSATLAPQ